MALARLTGPGSRLRRIAHMLRGAPRDAAAVRVRIGPWLGAHRGIRDYCVLSEDELRASRRSDTVFVFGSGASLNELADEDWSHIAEHDTFGFNWFIRQRFVRCDYQMVRELATTDFDPHVWRPQVDEYFRIVRESPLYRETVFLLQDGFRAVNANRALAASALPRDARVFRWKTARGRTEPSASFGEGLSHPHATLEECVNFAWLVGWRRIVLVGVDLYDRRYFWLSENETRDVDAGRSATCTDPHATVSSGLVEHLGRWSALFSADGVELSVYNPRSLLATQLPVYTGPA